MNPIRISLAQVNPTVGDLIGNVDRILSFARRASTAGAHLMVCPELCVSGYPPEDLILKSRFVEDCRRQTGRLAAQVPRGLVVVAGCPWPAPGHAARAYNAAVVLHDGQVKAVYHKMMLPNYGVFDEKRVFAPGDRPLVLDIGGARLSIQICEDSWGVDEGPCARLADDPVDAIVNVSASPYFRGKVSTRQDVLGSTARACACSILYCNLVGGQDELVFDGASFVLDASGAPVARARQFEEDLLTVDVATHRADTASVSARANPVDTVRIEPRPDGGGDGGEPRLEPRLEDHAEVYHALTLGLRDYVEKNRFRTVVVALSGGVDSALVATFAADALGRDRVVGITMPSAYSSAGTRADAARLATALGITLHEVPIGALFAQYRNELAPHWQGREPDVAEENLQARIRGTLIMAFSNKFGWLVLTTGNKSEVAVGYCTLYGDMVGGFAVIKDVPKTLVFDLCRWRNRRGEVIPASIIERPPSAELRPDQRDTDSLPPYDVLDGILERYVEEDQGLAEIVAAGFDAATTEQVLRLVDINEYKRRQSAPGIKITPKAFGRDRRLPITNAYRDRIGAADAETTREHRKDAP